MRSYKKSDLKTYKRKRFSESSKKVKIKNPAHCEPGYVLGFLKLRGLYIFYELIK